MLHAQARRRGVILLVVVALLTLFAVVGLSFVMVADGAATAARYGRDAESLQRPDLEPELLLAHFLGQLLFDVRDDETGVWSGLRGHSLARNLFGLDYALLPDGGYADADNAVPFNGTGRLRFASAFGQEDDRLINYTYFPGDDFLRDPERHGPRGGLRPAGARDNRAPFLGGFNPPYTYPDLNHLFLAAARADGSVLLPSFHRPWLFGSNDPENENWTNALGKYLLLRPRPVDQLRPGETVPRFPYPEDATGDVKNLLDAPGGNDSYWLDLDFPVRTLPDGRKYKPLFAPLVLDLDGRINLNVHGNVRGRDIAGNPTHLSNQGWGPWEVNLGHVLPHGREWQNLLLGSAGPPLAGRYGGQGTPGTARRQSAAGPLPHFYAQLDWDGGNERAGFTRTGRLQLPGAAALLQPFPTYPAGYGNGSGGRAGTERWEHPVLARFPQPAGDDRAFDAVSMEALLRYGGTGSAALTSDLFRLCPRNFADPHVRRLVTTLSIDLDRPGLSPWLYEEPQPYTVRDEAPAWPAQPFPSLQPGVARGEFAADGRHIPTAALRLDLNRSLPAYPSYPTGTTRPLMSYHGRYDALGSTPALDGLLAPIRRRFETAQKARQDFANDLYRQLLAVTGVPPPDVWLRPTAAELLPRRWLAQLAVNIVDFIDEDDISTPFHFYTATTDVYPPSGNAPAGQTAFDPGEVSEGNAELPKYWVFGTELPHVVLSEVLAEYEEPDPPAANAPYTTNVWVELLNPFQTPIAGQPLQTQDGLPVPLHVAALPEGQQSASGENRAQAFGPYRVVLTDRVWSRRDELDNVLGTAETPPHAATDDDDFRTPVNRMDGRPQQQQATVVPSPYLDLASGLTRTPFFLLGPPEDDARRAIAMPAVPAETPRLRSPNLRYETTLAEQPPAQGVTVLLRRLTNPHLPFNDQPRGRTLLDSDGNVLRYEPNPWYNPYQTVDYLESVPLRNIAEPAYASWGKRQPYASHRTQATDQVAAAVTPHTFGQQNRPAPDMGRPDWLVHLDRNVSSPMELLHVSGWAPHQLTQRFRTENQQFGHRAPWFDESRRVYRLFEYLTAHQRARGESVGLRLPGKVNVNTIWDPEILQALADARHPGDPLHPNSFTTADVNASFARLLALRSPDGRPNGPDRDRPFKSLATGHTPEGGLEDTLLRGFDGNSARRLFEPAHDPDSHPHTRYEMLTKMYNHLTTRSNVFAVWVTVGFFEVTDDAARPVKLGAEIGRAENRQRRHRLFAIVDRSMLTTNPGPQPAFNPREDSLLVPCFSIID